VRGPGSEPACGGGAGTPQGKVNWPTGPAIYTDEELLGYLAAEAGTSGVIALHGRDTEHTGLLSKRILSGARLPPAVCAGPEARTARLVRVEPSDVQRAFGDQRRIRARRWIRFGCSLRNRFTAR